MRTGPLLVLALALACTACDQIPFGNGWAEANGSEDSARPGARAPVATITLASAGGTDCSARWNGEAVSQDEIVGRGVAALDEAIRAAGGVGNITEQNLPFVRVEAPAAMAYSCVGPTLATLQRSGFAWAVLRPTDGGGPDARADFLIADLPEPVVPPIGATIGRGSLTLGGRPTDLAGIRAHFRALREGEEPPPEAARMDAPPPVTSAPNGFLVEVARDATFGEVHALVRTVAEAGETATLYSCAGPEGPQGTAAC